MPFLIFALLAAIPLVEIALLVQLGKWIGVWWTLAIVLGTAAAGTYVLHRQGFAVMNRVMASMAAGKPPVAPVIDGGFVMLAGLLLIAPGLLTDTLGLALLIPRIRHIVAAWSVRRLFRSMTVRTATFRQAQARAETPWPGQEKAGQSAAGNAETGQTDAGPGEPKRHAAPSDGPVIDGEFERLGERNLDPRRRANGDARGASDQTRPHDPRH